MGVTNQKNCSHELVYDVAPLYSRDNVIGKLAGHMGICVDDTCRENVVIDNGHYQRTGETTEKPYGVWGVENLCETELWRLKKKELDS